MSGKKKYYPNNFDAIAAAPDEYLNLAALKSFMTGVYVNGRCPIN